MPSTPTRKGPLSGQTIAGCRLRDRLGLGRTGNVYRAHCDSIQGVAAVKILRGSEASKPALREAFLREARAIAALDHENIVKIFDVLETPDTVVIVMQLLEGRNVWEMLQAGETFKPERAARIVLRVARALSVAHRQKLVHRDIKPQNIIVVARDQVKVVDFGLAALPGAGGDRVGTPHYMAPEQGARGRVDSAADIYSLGATFYHMLTGQTPYQGETVGEILRAHRDGKLVSPKQVDAMIPRAIDRLVRQMMAPAKGYRPSADDLVRQFEEILAETEWKRRRSQGRRGEGETEPPPPRHRRRSGGGAAVLIGGVFVLVMILGVVLAFVVMNREEPSPESPPESPRPAVVAGPATDTPPPPSPEEKARIRAQQADRALAKANGWIATHRKNVDECVRRLEAIAHDYPNSGAARRALKMAGDMQIAEAERKARAERPKIDTEELKNRWEICRKMLGRFRVEEVDGKLKVLKRDARHTVYLEKVENEIEAKLHVEYLRNSLIDSVFKKAVPYRSIKPDHPAEDAMIYDADIGGIHVRGGGKKWRVKWTAMVGGEVLGLARACLPQKNKALTFALGVYLVRAGLPKEARDQFDRTRLFQTAGEYNDLIERLGK